MSEKGWKWVWHQVSVLIALKKGLMIYNLNQSEVHPFGLSPGNLCCNIKVNSNVCAGHSVRWMKEATDNTTALWQAGGGRPATGTAHCLSFSWRMSWKNAQCGLFSKEVRSLHLDSFYTWTTNEMTHAQWTQPKIPGKKTWKDIKHPDLWLQLTK